MTGRDAGAGLLVLALGLTPGMALAQTDPFEAAMEEALTDAGTAGSLIRCTSLFRAFRLYAGEGTQVGATAAARETDLAVASVVIWQNDMGVTELDTAFEAIVPMVGDATDLYLARMSANRDAIDSVFDDTLETELTFCGTLHDEIAEQSSE
jgi:hypothetical protein